MNLTKVSKYISLILRHKPETIGITLDEHGWAKVDELIKGVSEKYPINMRVLEDLVRLDDKQRYSFNEDKTLIRANQGHSIPIDLELKETKPPLFLFHGTGEKYVEMIDIDGLIPKSRQYVHLSKTVHTAIDVGKRHGEPVIYLVESRKMYEQGYKFYCSANGVWLTNNVPVEFLQKQYFVDEL